MTKWKHTVLNIPKRSGSSAHPEEIAQTLMERMAKAPGFELVQAVESNGEWLLFMKQPAG